LLQAAIPFDKPYDEAVTERIDAMNVAHLQVR
jgi:hypothetical protein